MRNETKRNLRVGLLTIAATGCLYIYLTIEMIRFLS